MTSPTTTLVSARVPHQLAKSFGELAVRHDRSVSAELRLAMRERLSQSEIVNSAAGEVEGAADERRSGHA